MAYKFTEQEQARIQAAYDRAEQGQAPWWGLYEEVSSLLLAAIDRGDVASADVDEAKAAALWFDGAVKVNSWVSIPEA
ncbi:hypothetical protein [Pseudomonas indica]|uniref:hypothetical protein n=1 Tax=Pseudomonas indica TaxID=137658 RepID=UPI0023F8D13F|nr:hypothetical protein [Pseudomonas indica]MBU3055522.1 hypothetical protein [Pseudomonas indica]